MVTHSSCSIFCIVKYPEANILLADPAVEDDLQVETAAVAGERHIHSQQLEESQVVRRRTQELQDGLEERGERRRQSLGIQEWSGDRDTGAPGETEELDEEPEVSQ